MMNSIKIALDTDIFLSDFFYRNTTLLRPPATLDEEEDVTLRLQHVQDALDYLANLPQVSIYTSVSAFCRFAGVLSDLKLSPTMVKEEMEYICNNAGLLEISFPDIEKVMNKHAHPFHFETFLWEELADAHALSAVVTTKPHSSSVLDFLQPGTEFIHRIDKLLK